MPTLNDTQQEAEQDPLVIAAIQRGIYELKGGRITYNFPTRNRTIGVTRRSGSGRGVLRFWFLKEDIR